MRTLLPLLTSLLLLTLSACSKKDDPSAILSADKMEDVLFDYHLAQALVNQSGDSADFRIRVYAESVFKKHEITEEQFDNSLRYYHRHMPELHEIYKNLEERMNFLAGDFSKKEFTAEGDTADIWQGSQRYMLTSALCNYATFVQPADSLLTEGDKLELNFTASWLYKEGQRFGTAVLAVKYEGDSIVTSTQQFTGTGPQQIILRITNKKKIESIQGFIYQHTPWTPEPKILIISDVSLIRYHSTTPGQNPTHNVKSDIPELQRRQQITDSVRGSLPRKHKPFSEVNPEPVPQKQFHLGNH